MSKFLILVLAIFKLTSAILAQAETVASYSTHDSGGKVLGVFKSASGPGGTKAWRDPDGNVWTVFIGNYDNLPLKPDAVTYKKDSHGNVILGSDGKPEIDEISVTDSNAIRACEAFGSSYKLPSYAQYDRLLSYFELSPQSQKNEALSAQGQKDLHSLFPDMAGFGSEYPSYHREWVTTTMMPSCPSQAAAKVEYNGALENTICDYIRSFHYAVRCVVPAAH